MKQETLEEAANRYNSQFIQQNEFAIEDFINGAKWQQDRMYSEKDMREAIIFALGGMYGYQWGEEGETENQINKYLQEFKNK
jgi:hypothetical protein